ncbi:unnamed protein product [Camellia sinensis]
MKFDLGSSFQRHSSSFRSISGLSFVNNDVDDECSLQWAAIKRLPTFERLRSSLFDENDGSNVDAQGKRVVDVTKLGALERNMFIDKLIKHIENDNLRLLHKLGERIDKYTVRSVGVKLSTVEVRYNNLQVEAECEVIHGKPLPSGILSRAFFFNDCAKLPGLKSQEAKITVIDDVSGIIKPGSEEKEALLMKTEKGKQQKEEGEGEGKGERCRSASQKRIVSSANWRWDRFKFPDPIEAPLIKPKALALSNNTLRPSAAMLNKKGERGSPCLNPFCGLNSSVGDPLTRIEILAVVTQVFIQSSHLSPNPRLAIIEKRTTLLLGTPGCGKTTLLKALSGNLRKSLKVAGEVSYNGYKLEEFIPHKTSAYISENDLHIPEMTVRETLDFSVRCQGVGSRAEIMIEVSRREKQSGIVPNPDADIYMKAISAEGQKTTLQRLDICAYTLIGDAMRRGISGGQKKRLTTGEVILAHITDATILDVETFDLFDDIIFMAEGKIVYHGPCSHVLEFFEDCGFRCSERKGVADFLQEGYLKERSSIILKFKESPFGKKLDEELSKPFSKPHSHKNAISLASILFLNRHSFEPACKGTSSHEEQFFYLCVQINSVLVIIASVAMTVFWQTPMNVDAIHANYYLGALFYAVIILFFDGFPELSLTVGRLAVFYKQRDLYFYPAWAYAILATILKVPISLSSALIWTSLTYYVIGYSPEAGRASMPTWLKWGFWVSSLTYGKVGLALNEFLAPRWQKDRVVLPCEPLTLVFQDMQYYVDTPASAFTQKKLQLLCDITGAFRLGVLTALMGVCGTTLMDVLAGRKTSGTIEGDIRIGGFPKVQETFARISVEFVKEVLEIIEFDEIKDCLVGIF